MLVFVVHSARKKSVQYEKEVRESRCCEEPMEGDDWKWYMQAFAI